MKPVVIVAIAASAMAGVVAWRALRPHGKSAAPHEFVLFDRSASSTAGCDAVIAAVSDDVLEGRLSPDSVLVVLATGDADTSGEPTEIFRGTPVRPGRVMGGRRGAQKQQEAMLSRLTESCRELPPADISPIALGMRDGLEGLRAQGCGPESRCRLRVISDGEETVEPWIVQSLSGKRTAPAARPRMDNGGVEIVFCGTSQTKGASDRARDRRRAHDVGRVERMRKTWRSTVTAPDLMHFEAHCQAGHLLVASEARP